MQNYFAFASALVADRPAGATGRGDSHSRVCPHVERRSKRLYRADQLQRRADTHIPEREGDYTDVWLASEHTVDALTDWVRSSSFRREIQSQLAEPDTPLDSLNIAADNVRNVGAIYFSHGNSEALRTIVDAAMLVLTTRSQEYFPQLGGDSAQVTILDQASVTAAGTPLTNRLSPLIRLGIAVLIGLALAFFAEYVDQTIYHQDDLRRLGLPLLGSIPRDRA